MEPAIQKNSSVNINFKAYDSAEPERFDIVAFHPPGQDHAVYLFRVAGLAGETIRISDRGLHVNGKLMTPPNDIVYRPVPSGINRVTLKASEFFLLGDNTAHARDSRRFGPVGRERILGSVSTVD